MLDCGKTRGIGALNRTDFVYEAKKLRALDTRNMMMEARLERVSESRGAASGASWSGNARASVASMQEVRGAKPSDN